MKIKIPKFKINLSRFMNMKTVLVVVIGLFIATVGIIYFSKTRGEAASWYNDNWTYRRPYTVSNGGAADTNKRIKIDIDTATLTTDKLQADCGDSRFVDSTGRLLKYYIDTAGGACDGASTDYWILLPNIIAGTSSIYHYYGNPAATNGTEGAQFSESALGSYTTTAGTESIGLGPIASWKLDEGYGSTAYNGAGINNGTLGSGTSAPTWVTEDLCVSGKCLKFDGSNDVLSVGTTVPSIQTVSFWARLQSISTTQELIDLNGTDYVTSVSGVITVNGFGTETIYVDGRPASTITANNWHFISVTTSSSLSGGAVKMGKISTNHGQAFIDDVKFYPYARTAAQIKADYASRGSVHGVSAQFGDDDLSRKLSSGLVGYWKLDVSSGTAPDSSGNGNSLTNNNSTPYGAGKFGNAGSLIAGSSNYFSVGSTINNIQSIVFWTKPTTTSDEYININATTYITSSSGTLSATGVTSPSIYVNGVSNGTITANSWNHVVVTTATALTGGSFEVGRANGSYLTGSIDDVRIYNRALSPREVSQLYEFAPGPVGWWKMDENTSTTVNDRSGNDNQITFPAPVSAGYVKSVEYVQINLTTTETTDSVNLSKGQTITDSIPFVTSLVNTNGSDGADDDFREMMVDVSFASGPNRVVATRTQGDAAASTINVGVYVVEFDTALVNVQQGTFSMTAAGLGSTAPITAVDQNKSAMVFYYRSDAPTNAEDDWSDHSIAGWLSSDTAASFQRDTAAGIVNGHYYIFEAQNTEFSVQASTFTIGAGVTGNTATISSIDMSKSFVIGSYRGDANNDNNDEGSLSIFLNSATQVGAALVNTGGSISDVRTYVVTFAGNESVQRGTFTYASLDGEETASITEVDLDYAFAWNPNMKQGNMLSDGLDTSDVMEAFQLVGLTTPTLVKGTRTAANATSNSSGKWEVVEFAAGAESDPSPIWVPGKYSSGLQFDGSDDFISLADNADFDFAAADNFTVSAWVKHDGAIATNEDYILTKADATTGGYKLYMDASGDFCFVTDDDSTWDTSDSACTSAVDYDDGNWHYVTGVKTGTSKIELFVDGVLVASDASLDDTNTLANGNALYIGVDRDGTSNPWDGTIDDPRVYRYARTQKQIVSDMNAGHPAPGSPVGSALLHYKFDEGYGLTANNSGNVGSTANGTLATGSSAPTWTNAGKFGKALSFDGNDYINTSKNFRQTDGTISLWFKGSASAIDKYLLGQQNSNPTLTVYQNSEDKLKFWIRNSAATSVALVSTNTINDDTWHSFVGTWGANGMKLYIDGILNSSDPTTIYDDGSTSSMIIGGLNIAGGPNYFWPGSMDQVKIYSYALTSDEVKLEYNQGKSIVLGAKSVGVGASGASFSAGREYCVPGDASTCNPPVGEWKMDEGVGGTANDTSGNGRTGTLGSGNSAPTWATGKFGPGLKFDGANDKISVSDFTMGTNALSISGWMKFNNYTGSAYNSLIAKQDEYVFYAPGSSGAFAFYIYGSSADCTTTDAYTNIQNNEWIYFTGVYNGTAQTKKIYVNGQEVASTACNAGVLDNTVYTFYLGRGTGETYWVNGLMDQVRIYDYARTPAQIAWEFNKGAPIAHYKFDECQGTTAYNSVRTFNDAPAGNNGTIYPGASGNTAVGTCTSGTSTHMWYNGATGKRGASLDFDGTNDYVKVNDASTLEPSNTISLSAWVKTSQSGTNFIGIIDKYSGSAAGYMLDLPSGTNMYPRFTIRTDQTPTAGQQVTATIAINDGSWHHIIGTYDTTSCKIYIDGKLNTSASCTGTPVYDSHALIFGGDGVSTNFFAGQIDDVKIFNYVLTAAQIKTEMAGGAVRFE